jgi:hypothetical protein
MTVAINQRIQCHPADPGVGPGVLITSSTSNITLDPCGRRVTVSTAGTITGKLVGDTGDQAYILPAGTHEIAFRSITSISSLVGFITR